LFTIRLLKQAITGPFNIEVGAFRMGANSSFISPNPSGIRRQDVLIVQRLDIEATAIRIQFFAAIRHITAARHAEVGPRAIRFNTVRFTIGLQ
jgi:hypothetical protein